VKGQSRAERRRSRRQEEKGQPHWAALAEVCPQAEELRCWNHRIMNVIEQLPKKRWAAARELLRQIAYADTRAQCEQRRDEFVARYSKAHPKAAETLSGDWERLVARSATSRRNTGATCVRPTPWSHPSPARVCAPRRRNGSRRWRALRC
jgi:hypothetical protein